jgi:hypothetical protein
MLQKSTASYPARRSTREKVARTFSAANVKCSRSASRPIHKRRRGVVERGIPGHRYLRKRCISFILEQKHELLLPQYMHPRSNTMSTSMSHANVGVGDIILGFFWSLSAFSVWPMGRWLVGRPRGLFLLAFLDCIRAGSLYLRFHLAAGSCAHSCMMRYNGQLKLYMVQTRTVPI